jgi:thiosulfate dehydrogenase
MLSTTRLFFVAVLSGLMTEPLWAQTPGDAWMVSLGGRLYDNQWLETGLTPPSGRNPLYPADVNAVEANTWRCVACHGWDYSGRDGHLGKVSTSPVFFSLRASAGKNPAGLVNAMKSPGHTPLLKGLAEGQVRALAIFVSIGQFNARKLIPGGKSIGNPLAGKDIFEGACVSCHQADGKAYIEGESGDRSALGWVAQNRPTQALHKITNGVPGADMLSLRFLDEARLADLLAYVQTLDASAE